MSQNLDLTQLYTRRQVQTVVSSSVAAATSSLSAEISTASAQATQAMSAINAMASDNVLSPSEKSQVVLDIDVIHGEQAGIDAQATAYGVTSEKTSYDAAITALNSYLATLTLPRCGTTPPAAPP